MPLTFPSSPTNGQTYVVGSRTWTWNGSIWEFNNSAIGVSSVGESEIINGSVTQAKLASTVSGITICTSSTRPGSPFEGQMIYETNTDILAIYNGSAWRQLAAATASSGSVLQVVQGLWGTGVQNNTNVLADTGLSATITPKSASSKILIQVTQNGVSKESGNTASSVYLSLRRDASEIHAYNSFLHTGTSSLVVATWSHTQLDSPATTSAITYKTQFCNMVNAAGTYVQRSIGSGWQTSVMVLTEIAG